MASRKKQLTKLEAKMGSAAPAATGFPKVVVMQPGETEERALQRTFPDGLPPAPSPPPPGCPMPPRFIFIVPVKAPPRHDHD